MDTDRINPELRDVYRRIPQLPFNNRLFLRLARVGMRVMQPRERAEDVVVETRRVTAGKARLYRPKRASGAALLWIHGGGLICGLPAQNHLECLKYARELGLVVAAVPYRLAPEHPYPAAIDDCHAGWRWLQGLAVELGFDPARVVIAGQSAGGGLTAALAQRLADEGGVQPAAQLLHCPMLDDRTAARLELDRVKHKMWNNRSNRAGWSWYLGHAAGEAESRPYAVPARRDDLAGLPPAWIGIGDADLFMEESAAYRDRLRGAGVRCDWHESPGGFHGFEGVAPDAAVTRAFWDDNFRYLREILGLAA
jgi:acetyl esterase/lipase